MVVAMQSPLFADGCADGRCKHSLAYLFLLQLNFGGNKTTKKRKKNQLTAHPSTRPSIEQPPFFLHSGRPLARRRPEQPPEDGVQFSTE